MIQARSAATAAWLNLLPHLTSNLIWRAPLPSYVSVIATLQGLTPFLLPNWWLDAKISSLQTKVTQDSLSIMQADLASTIEQLFYAYERDSKVLCAYQKVSTNTLNFSEIQNWIQPLQSNLEQVLKRDRYAISLALGKHNPEAVAAISLDGEVESLQQAMPISEKALADRARRRSFELDQLDYLIQISKIKTLELYFTWLDPSGDQRVGLGFNLIGQTRGARSQTEELKIQKEQTEAVIYKNAYLISLEYNTALNLSKNFKSQEQIESTWQKIEQDLKPGKAQESALADSFKALVQSYLSDVTQYETQLAAFRVARAKKDRLLLEGHFEDLLPQLPSLNLEPTPIAPTKSPPL